MRRFFVLAAAGLLVACGDSSSSSSTDATASSSNASTSTSTSSNGGGGSSSSSSSNGGGGASSTSSSTSTSSSSSNGGAGGGSSSSSTGTGGATMCDTSGNIFIDWNSSMGCYSYFLLHAGSAVPFPESAKDDGMCVTSGCGNSPAPGDREVIWANESGLPSVLISVGPNLPSYTAYCSPQFTMATPPSVTQLHNLINSPPASFTPDKMENAMGGVYNITITLPAGKCVGQSWVAVLQY